MMRHTYTRLGARAEDGMSAPAAGDFIGIGPLSEALGVSRSLVRKLEADGTLPPAPRLAGSDRRVYRPQDVALYQRVLDLRRTDRRRDRRT